MHCKQARKQIAGLAQPAEAPTELTQHAAQCEACARLYAERIALHNALANLRAETATLGPSTYVEQQVLAALNASTVNPRRTYPSRRWITASAFAVAALLIAAVLFTFIRTHKALPNTATSTATSIVTTKEEPFTAMPYVVPPAPYERTTVIRTQVSLQIMQYAGFEVHDNDLGSTTLADVLYGEDGRILALRLVSQPNPASERRID